MWRTIRSKSRINGFALQREDAVRSSHSGSGSGVWPYTIIAEPLNGIQDIQVDFGLVFSSTVEKAKKINLDFPFSPPLR